MYKTTQPPRMRWTAPVIICALIVTATHSAAARTIELQAKALDRAAVISAHAPLASWAGYQDHANSYRSTAAVIGPASALLIRYDLSAIPEDMRVTKAEWFLPVHERDPREARLFVWRMLSKWGIGVCHKYRTRAPEQEAWDEPGGQGAGVDRAMQPTLMARITENHTAAVINVTQDVSLWHRGVVANEGWMLTVDDRGSWVRLGSPLNINGSDWTLRITYEPK